MIPGKFLRLPLLAICVLGMFLIVAVARGGVVLTTLVSFTGTNGACPGASPFCGLISGPDGNFYGTTSAGGSNNLGTVFQLTSGGVFTSLFSFNGTNGSVPYAALAPDNKGNLYGSTFLGGASNWGTLFLITTNGGFTNLSSFTGTNYPALGANPTSPLLPDGAGNFYSTAAYGGAYTNATPDGNGYGTVFKLAGDGTVTVLAFFNNTNGARPTGGLVLGQDGNYYGTTTWGGQGIKTFRGFGTVFKMSPDGTLTNLYLFSGNGDGGQIYPGLVQGKDGCFYGGAFSGGSTYGTLFKITTNGTFTVLHTFSFSDNGSPYGSLIIGSDGNLYGTTFGAYAGHGSVFQLTPDGVFTNLVFFKVANGSHPDGVLVQGPDNNFYGTTSQGGANGFGTIFRLSVPLPPVIKSIGQANGVVTLTWSTVAGQTYQAQYSTNLAQTGWIPCTKPFVASSGTMTAVDIGAARSAQRFYRIVISP